MALVVLHTYLYYSVKKTVCAGCERPVTAPSGRPTPIRSVCRPLAPAAQTWRSSPSLNRPPSDSNSRYKHQQLWLSYVCETQGHWLVHTFRKLAWNWNKICIFSPLSSPQSLSGSLLDVAEDFSSSSPSLSHSSCSSSHPDLSSSSLALSPESSSSSSCSSQASLPVYNKQVADSCIIRVSVESVSNGNVYKSILVRAVVLQSCFLSVVGWFSLTLPKKNLKKQKKLKRKQKWEGFVSVNDLSSKSI